VVLTPWSLAGHAPLALDDRDINTSAVSQPAPRASFALPHRPSGVAVTVTAPTLSSKTT